MIWIILQIITILFIIMILIINKLTKGAKILNAKTFKIDLTIDKLEQAQESIKTALKQLKNGDCLDNINFSINIAIDKLEQIKEL